MGDVALVEDLVRLPVLGKAVEGEVDLVVGGPMVDGVDAAGELGREVVAVEELGEGRGGIEVGDDDGRGDHVAVREGHALDATIGHDDMAHLHVAP